MGIFFKLGLIIFLVACSGKKVKNLNLKLLFPKNSPQSLAVIRSQADYLKIRFDSLEGWHHEATISTQLWESIELQALSFPKKESDVLQVQVEVWGKEVKQLQGRRQITAKEQVEATEAFTIVLYRTN